MEYLLLSVTFCTSVVRFLPTCNQVLTILRNISGQRNAVRSLQGKKHFKVTVGWFYIYVRKYSIKQLKYQQKHFYCKKHQTKARRNFEAILYSGFVKVNLAVYCWCFIHRRLQRVCKQGHACFGAVSSPCSLCAHFLVVLDTWFISPKLG